MHGRTGVLGMERAADDVWLALGVGRRPTAVASVGGRWQAALDQPADLDGPELDAAGPLAGPDPKADVLGAPVCVDAPGPGMPEQQVTDDSTDWLGAEWDIDLVP